MSSFSETMSGEIIEIQPLSNIDKEYFSINWNIGKRCNFSCSYCPRDLHDAESPHKTIDELIFAWKNILEVLNKTGIKKKIKIEFSGGEPTLNPEFMNFCIHLKKNYSHLIKSIGVTTNGSRHYSYFKKLLKNLNWVTFSNHFEFMNESLFYRNVLLSKRNFPNVHVAVNLMIEEWTPKKVSAMLDILQKENVVVHAHKIRNYYNSKGIKNRNLNDFNYEEFLKEQKFPIAMLQELRSDYPFKKINEQNIIVRTMESSYRRLFEPNIKIHE
jgi:organic radical activating enzyme